MDETALHALLDRALEGEPPIGPLTGNSLLAGTRLRTQSAVGGLTVAAAIAAIVPLATSAPNHTSAEPPPGHGDAHIDTDQ